jgi:Flp pilus assembly protein TadG
MSGWKKARSVSRQLRKDRDGVAAIEFAVIAGFLCVAISNVTDTGIYLYTRMEVENAALVGTMQALKTCDASHVPATTKCNGLTAAVTAAIQSTSLGTAVTLSGGAVTEGYYCVNSSNTLEYVSTVSNKPESCSAVGMPALYPADYLTVTVTYTYTPLFTGISVGGLFTTPIVKAAMVRML